MVALVAAVISFYLQLSPRPDFFHRLSVVLVRAEGLGMQGWGRVLIEDPY